MPIGRVTSSMMNNINNLSHLSGFNRTPGNRNSDFRGLSLADMLQSAAEFATAGAARAGQLRNTIASLPAIFDRVSAVSGNNDVVRVESFIGSRLPETSIQVSQIAMHQQNAGTSLQANSRVVEPGTFAFEIQVDGVTRMVTFTTTETMTNRAFQDRMAQAINSQNIGVTASVSAANNQSTLTLSTRETGAGTGENPRFTIRDVTGNAVELTGVGESTQDGQNAIFYVNGGEQQTSRSNEVIIGGNLTVTLRSASDEPVEISEGRDENGIRAAIRQIVSQINSLLESARDNQVDRRTRSVAREIESIIRRNRRALSEVGVGTSQSGFLTLNDDVLREAVANGTTDNLFRPQGRMQSGFINTLTRLTDSVSQNPTRHISPQVARLPEFRGIMAQVQRDANQSRQISQLQNQQATLSNAADVNNLLNSILNGAW